MKDFLHSFNRRCKGHEYRSRCIYMITMLKSPDAPLFSSVTAEPGAAKLTPVVSLFPVGEIIYRCLNDMCRNYPQLKILRRIAMPDHIHFELFVTERTVMSLGSMMAAFKSACTNQCHSAFPESLIAKDGSPLFTKGFNDKIAFRAGAKDAFYNYIADNPRRYLVKKMHRDYFFHKTQIIVGNKRCGLYGNIFLLDNPVKSFVKISRRKETMTDLDERIKEWEETIRCGGVLVSPFINPEEKVYRDAAIANGNGIILIVNYRFSDRAKPYKELFDLCAEGRLLIISTEEFATAPKQMQYSYAREMNEIAAQVAALAPCAARLVRRQ